MKFRWERSYMRKGILIYEEMQKFFVIYEEAVLVIYDFATATFWISSYMRKIFFFIFISVPPVQLPCICPFIHPASQTGLCE